jgi:hypothetical protein
VTTGPTATDDAALRKLLRGTAVVAGIDDRSVRLLGDAILATPPPGAGRLGGRSALNHDGSPLQLCLTADAQGVRSRLLGDPAHVLGDGRARYRASLAAVDRVLAASGSESLGELVARTLDLNLPTGPDEPFDYPDGVLWLGAGVGTPGAAVYMDARRGGPEPAWARLGRWLRAVAGDSADVDAFVSGIRGRSRLMSLGIEGLSASLARAKVYWRLPRPMPLADTGVSGFDHPDFASFLRLCVGEREIRLTGIVLNAGFGVGTGRRSDTKLDVCGCPGCLALSDQEAVETVDRLTDRWDLPRLPVARALRHGELAFLGFGLDHRLHPRLNVYIKPLRRRSTGDGPSPAPRDAVAVGDSR